MGAARQRTLAYVGLIREDSSSSVRLERVADSRGRSLLVAKRMRERRERVSRRDRDRGAD